MGPPPLSSLRSIQTSIRPNGASIPADRRPVLSLRPLWARQLSVTRGTLRVPCRIGFQPFLSVGSRAREPCGFLAGSASSRFSPLGHEQGNPAGSLQNRLPAVSLRWVASKANPAGSLQDRLPAVSLRWVTSKANPAGSLQNRLPAVSLRWVASKGTLRVPCRIGFQPFLSVGSRARRILRVPCRIGFQPFLSVGSRARRTLRVPCRIGFQPFLSVVSRARRTLRVPWRKPTHHRLGRAGTQPPLAFACWMSYTVGESQATLCASFGRCPLLSQSDPRDPIKFAGFRDRATLRVAWLCSVLCVRCPFVFCRLLSFGMMRFLCKCAGFFLESRSGFAVAWWRGTPDAN